MPNTRRSAYGKTSGESGAPVSDGVQQAEEGLDEGQRGPSGGMQRGRDAARQAGERSLAFAELAAPVRTTVQRLPRQRRKLLHLRAAERLPRALQRTLQ